MANDVMIALKPFSGSSVYYRNPNAAESQTKLFQLLKAPESGISISAKTKPRGYFTLYLFTLLEMRREEVPQQELGSVCEWKLRRKGMSRTLEDGVDSASVPYRISESP
nr:hypothetical protein Iba_chr12aCG14340 [Ipomoea batatas]GMD70785.1 hypothetical protein Iba_chr12eCG9680 [Ipomoea batatas]